VAFIHNSGQWACTGKLLRCDWIDESVSESPAWTDLAPERETERRRLEEKQKAALGKASEPGPNLAMGEG
jgi:hypothetical protein